MASYGRSARTRSGVLGALEGSTLLLLTVHEVKLGFKNNLQRIWMLVIFFFGFLFLLSQQELNGVFSTLIFFGFFGSIISVVLAASTVSGEVGGIADSLLSKAVRRWEYLLSKFLSQIVLALSVYLVMVGISVTVLSTLDRFPDDMSGRNLLVAIGMVGMVLVFFSSIGVMFSSFASKSVFPILMGIVVWFVFIFLFLLIPNWDLMYSPVSILENLGHIVESRWGVEWWRLVTFYVVSPIIFFLISLGFFYQRDL
jgi:ABC-type transport system involved in multi-copper enzyme maturation permease subunit